ncbi:MAG TPA: alpha/beta fold hydrolase, partial [Candidatus Saccharimonadales bacterium]|nr:alpha/beta fold hydrolase [Candidatus Saccharimonadales bacterium]
MIVEFHRFKTSDGVQLRGWFSDADGQLVIVHIHGMSGNGYENRFLDNQRQLYNQAGIAFFTFDNRGSGIINHFPGDNGTKLGGSCFEIFEESTHDIQGAIDFMKSKGKSKFILQGHSLGASKVVNFLQDKREEVQAAILLAPTDMAGWAKTDPRHQEYLDKAEQLNAAGKGEELVGAQCWLDKTPLSAQTYPTIAGDGAVDMYAPRDGGSLLSKVDRPMIIIYG